mgnify:CR=1 FL=1
MVVMRKNNRIEVVDEKDRRLYESKGYAVVNTARAKKQESGNGGDNAKKNLEKDIEKILN